MFRILLVFAFGVACGRSFARVVPPARWSGSRLDEGLAQGRSLTPASMVFDLASAVSPAGDPPSAARTYAMRIATISADASDATRLALAKVHAGIVDDPHNKGLLDESGRLAEVSGSLAQAFLTLYAKQLAEEALGIIAGSTDQLKARAAEMPAATKSVGQIQPVVSAAVNVGTAISKA